MVQGNEPKIPRGIVVVGKEIEIVEVLEGINKELKRQRKEHTKTGKVSRIFFLGVAIGVTTSLVTWAILQYLPALAQTLMITLTT